MWFGYRTPMAMKNRDTWEFAHRHFGRTWYITGLIMLVVSLGVMIYVRAEGTERIGTIGGVFSMIQCLVMLAVIFPTEVALRRTFDRDGKRKWTLGGSSMSELPTLRSERLVLRPFRLSDARRVQKLAGAKEIAATTLNIAHPYEDGLAEEWISGLQKSFNEDKKCTLAICLNDGDLLVGAIDLTIFRSHEKASLGYWVGRDYWGRGYCTEAARMMVKFGFENLGLSRIFATHLEHNPASGRVMEKLGMKREGVLRKHVKKWGKYYDLVYYGILKSEYEDLKRPNEHGW